MNKRCKKEITAIYIVSLLLAVSLSTLTSRAIESNSSENFEDKYPSLNVENISDIGVPEQKTIYFTFDDGPSKNTEQLLEVLREENVKATFFVCAQCADYMDVNALMKRILEDGHELGLHSYTHDYKKIYRSLESYLEDLNAINDFIIEATGHHADIIRFPGGSCSKNASPAVKKAIQEEITRRGYRFYDWDVVSGDQISGVVPAKELARNILRAVGSKNTAIVLMHDGAGQNTTPDAVRIAVAELREQGYAFDKLTSSVKSKNIVK